MKNPNEYLENTFKSIVTQEKFTKWITAKQVNFFVSVCGLEKSRHFRANQTSSLNYVGRTDKYDINIYVSPVNKAGSITIVNMTLTDERLQDERTEEYKKIEKEISEIKESYKEQLAKPTSEWDHFDKIYMPSLIEKIENLENKLKSLA